MLKETSSFLALCVVFLVALIGVSILRLYPDWLDWPVARALNNLTKDHPRTTELAYCAAYPIVEGLISVSLIWYAWFSSPSPESRAKLVIGIGAAVLAGLASHFLRYQVPPAPKPIFNPLLQLHTPSVFGAIDTLRANSFPDSPTFPSERAVLFAGLSLAILMVRRDLGLLSLGCFAVIEFSRVYLGLHYLTDLAGSFLLAGVFVALAQLPWCVEAGRWFLKWERAWPWAFYSCALLASFQLITAFHELRLLLRLVAKS